MNQCCNEINFLSYDGVRLKGILSKPKEKVKAAVLMLHGVPSSQDEWGLYTKMAEVFCENGIASLRFNYRFWFDGVNRYGELNKLTLSQIINDNESAYWELKSIVGNIPIYVVAISFAGGVSIKWINSFNRSIKGVYLLAPCFDYEYEVLGIYKNYSSNKVQLLTSEQLDSLKKKKCINQGLDYGIDMVNEAHVFNIYNELNSINSKIIVFQGTNDSVVPIEITEKVLVNYPHIKLDKIENAKHSFGGPKKKDGTSDHAAKNKNIQFIINEIMKDII